MANTTFSGPVTSSKNGFFNTGPGQLTQAQTVADHAGRT
jgi:hypothetical protein